MEPTDDELVRRAAGGDHASFRALTHRHARSLYALALSLVGSAADAEDVVQETFVGAYRGLGRFEGRSSVRTWLMRIAMRQAARWRERRPPPAVPLEALGESGDPVAPRQGPAALADVDRRIDVQALLRRIGAEHREVLVLREIDGRSYDEIAGILEIPRGTVQSRLFRARAELRELLKDMAKHERP